MDFIALLCRYDSEEQKDMESKLLSQYTISVSEYHSESINIPLNYKGTALITWLHSCNDKFDDCF